MTKQQSSLTLNTSNNSNIYSITTPFEQGLTMEWQSNESKLYEVISTSLIDWLFDNASLTKRLLKHCQNFEVKVLPSTKNILSDDECSMCDDADILCREVLLICDGVPQVYARTLIPTTTFNHANEQLKSLKNSSLGDILFNDPSMKRSHIEVCNVESPSTLMTLSQQLSLPTINTIWGRRSMFYLQDYPLSVAEFFLPNSYAYSKALL